MTRLGIVLEGKLDGLGRRIRIQRGVAGLERLLHFLRVGWNVLLEQTLHLSHVVLHFLLLFLNDPLLHSAAAGWWRRCRGLRLLHFPVGTVLACRGLWRLRVALKCELCSLRPLILV